MACALVLSALSQKKGTFRSGVFLNRVPMEYLGRRGDNVTKGDGENYIMRSPINFAFRLMYKG